MADALDSKSSVLLGVWVQVPPPAFFYKFNLRSHFLLSFIFLTLFHLSIITAELQQNG